MSQAETRQVEVARSEVSRVEVSRSEGARTGAVRPSVAGRAALFRSELSLTFRRTRTIALLAILASLPVLIGVVVKLQTGDSGQGGGPAFIAQVTQNGLFLVFTSLAVSLPVF